MLFEGIEEEEFKFVLLSSCCIFFFDISGREFRDVFRSHFRMSVSTLEGAKFSRPFHVPYGARELAGLWF